MRLLPHCNGGSQAGFLRSTISQHFDAPVPLGLLSAIDANLPAALGISSTCVLTVPKLAP
jgi:hypothetical protein